MKRFRNLAVKYKILAGYFGMLAMFLILGLYFIYSTHTIKKATRQVEARNFRAVKLITDLQALLGKVGSLSRILERPLAQEDMLEHRREIEIDISRFKELLSKYALLIKNEPAALEKFAKITDNFKGYEGLLQKKFEAVSKGEILKFVEEEVVLKQLGQALGEMQSEDVSGLSGALGRIDRLARGVRNSYFRLILITFLIAVLFACGIARVIVSPIKDLVIATRRLGSGDLDYRIEVKSSDEIGTLESGFVTMAGRLKRAYNDLQKERDELENKVRERTKELAQSQMYLRRITDGIEEGIMLIDTNFKILWANKKIMNSTGVKESQIAGDYCYRITHHQEEPCQPPDDICPIAEVLKTKKPVSVIHTHLDKEGNKFFAEVTAYPLVDEKGGVSQFIHVSRDVTKRLELEEKLKENISVLEKTRSELQQRVEELGKFVRLSVDRELKMIELKQKIKELEGKQNA